MNLDERIDDIVTMGQRRQKEAIHILITEQHIDELTWALANCDPISIRDEKTNFKVLTANRIAKRKSDLERVLEAQRNSLNKGDK